LKERKIATPNAANNVAEKTAVSARSPATSRTWYKIANNATDLKKIEIEEEDLTQRHEGTKEDTEEEREEG
jgi:hypothetical protein